MTSPSMPAVPKPMTFALFDTAGNLVDSYDNEQEARQAARSPDVSVLVFDDDGICHEALLLEASPEAV